mmetsp:Transcript_4966/g.18033  ORF Transcript_4966/g.18033 Transcript_4966/m.18033 type:complete len:237 (-) Transcript_4966:1041-1751(-)
MRFGRDDYRLVSLVRRKALGQDVHDRPKVLLDLHRRVSVFRCKAFKLLLVVRNLAVGELQAVCGTDHHSTIGWADDLRFTKLFESSERNTSVGAVKHTRQVGFRRSIHHLFLSSLLNNTIALRERVNRAINRHRITDLNRRRERRFRLDSFERFPTILVRAVKRVGVVRLRDHHTRKAINKSEILAHLETLEESINVTEVTTRNDDVIRHFPVELLENFNSRRLLPFKTQRVQRVG